MDIRSFIDNLSQNGFRFEVIGSKLSVLSAKEVSLTEQQKQYIKTNQKHIIDFLEKNESKTKINKVEKSNIIPLSFAQQRLWFIDKLYAANSYAYNMPIAFRVKGELQLDLLEDSFNQLVKRYDILRTVFKQNADGQVCQEILPFEAKTKIKILVHQIDVADLNQYLLSESLKKFDLSSEQLIRVQVYNLKDQADKILFINQHHIISDAWSLNLLFQEVAVVYNSLKSDNGRELPPVQVQYADYVFWEKEHLQHNNLAKQLKYWDKNLKGYSDLNLVSGDSRPKLQINKGSSISFKIEEDVVKQLKEFARQFNSTVHMVLLSVFYILLYRYSKQHDMVIGIPYANRDALQSESILGFFVNMLPLRINIENPTIAELLEYVKKQCIDSYQNQNIPFEYIIEQLKIKRDSSRTPIFQVAFAHHNAINTINLVGAQIEKINFDRGTAKYDLNLTFEMNDNELNGELEFNTSLFNDNTANNIVEIYKLILVNALQNHNNKLCDIKLLSQAAYDKIVYKTNASKKLCSQNRTIHQIFEEQVEKTPNQVAIVFAEQQLTYEELNKRSNQLANFIRFKYKEIYNKEIEANIFIGLYIDRSLETIIAILAILKSGAAYVPFDADIPSERLKFQITDSDPSIILTTANKYNHILTLTDQKHLLVNLDDDENALSKYSDNNLTCINTATDPIYIIYTSGSTGKPKGVVQLHHNVRRLFWTCEKYFNFTENDVWTLFHSYSFDFSVWEMWGALLYGGKLIIPSFLETRDLNLFYQLLAHHKVTVLNQTPTAFYQLAKIDINHNTELQALRYVIFGGELLKVSLLKNWVNKYGIDKPQLINMYGITETTVHASYKRILHKDLTKQISNIGKPLHDLTVYVLDDNFNPVPIGIPGELFIGGCGLAKCYLNLPQLTTEKFISNPFVSEDDRKNNFNLQLYKTGDLVRWLVDGELEYIGRNDHQIQLRGFRIELEEIAKKLSSHESINNAVVLYKERLQTISKDTIEADNSLKYLCAYYTINEVNDLTQNITNNLLREYLKQSLPDYMIPSYFVQLTAFPLTINGKLDTSALPDPNFSEVDISSNYTPPRNELEHKLCNIWQELLGISKVSINSNFFEIGGNSILLTQLVAKIKNNINLDLSLVDLLTYPNIKLLVEHLLDKPKVQNINVKPRNLINKSEIAVIGYSGAFSGSESVDELWEKIFNGVDCITRLSVEDAIKTGAKAQWLKQTGHVGSMGLVVDIDKFDASFFGISPGEARFIDPQTRLFIEHCWNSLELAGYICKRDNVSIGVFAGAGKPTYLYNNLKQSSIINEDSFDWEMDTLADPRRIASLTSFYLNLHGPSIFVDTACSTSLVAITEAAEHLQAGLCEMAIAGASTLYFPENFGYIHKNSMVGSVDGICAPFSQNASGIVPGSGVGVVILKRLEDAIRDNDNIYAVIKGYGINNDGKRKVGYVAPSVQGQKDCIIAALHSANVPVDSISYIECHGTGTKLGDSVEISALKEIFTVNNAEHQKPFLGSIKANIGHADTAAGIASFIKVCKMFENKKIPPQINCDVINEQINDAHNIFKITNQSQTWQVNNYPRRAGITSLGIGGTNAHIILEEAAETFQKRDTKSSIFPQLFSISAKSTYSLIAAKNKLLEYLKKSKSVNLQNVAYTLHSSRESMSNRYAFVATDYATALQTLENSQYEDNTVDIEKNLTVVFSLSMLEQENFSFSNELYQIFPCYRQTINKCGEILKLYLHKDFTVIVNQADYADIVGFILGYALSQLLISLDIKPTYIIAVGSEEYLAACIAGVISLEDALCVMVKRLEIFTELKINKLSTPDNHSLQLAQAAEKLRPVFSRLKFDPAKIAFLSNLTGKMINEHDLLDSDYWYKHAHTLAAMQNDTQQLFLRDDVIIINIGTAINELLACNTVSILKSQQQFSNYVHFIDCIGKLWLQGVNINWEKFYEERNCYRLSLPTYAFEKTSFWVKSEIEDISQQINKSYVKEPLHIDDATVELALFWEQVFEIKNIDINANFFELGGNSVIAIRLTQLISDHFNIDISINTLFDNPTISSFSQVLSNYRRTANNSAALNINHNQNAVSNQNIINNLKKIWLEVFVTKNIDINANFFDIGGNSVIAIRLVQLISDHFNCEISINTLFENPTIATLSAVLSKNLTKTDEVFKQIIPDTQNAYKSFPLTDIQRAYVLGRQNVYDLGNVATHAYIERNYYDLDIDKLEATFNKLIQRHPMLRVIFDVNSVTQRILPDVPYYKIRIQHIDAIETDEQETRLSFWRNEMSHQVLDITTWPIFDIRCSILPDKIKLHMSFEVLVLDGQSLNILMSEWTRLYNNPDINLSALDCGFRDCVLNYHSLRQSNRYARDKEYWLQRIKSFPPRPNLPLKTQPEYIKSPSFKRCAKYIDMQIWNKFKIQCSSFKPNITPTAALALIYGIVLARWSKNNHFAINLTFFNRLPLHNDIDNIVGDFTSLELLEINLSKLSSLSFIDKAFKLQTLLYTDLDHVLFSGVEVQREINRISGNYKSVSYPIVFTSLLSLNMHGGAFLADTLIDDTANDITQTSQVWLDNKAYELKQGFVAEWDYVEELFPEGMIESMHQCYCHLIEYFADADWSQAQLPELLDVETLDLINSVNVVTKKFPEKLLHESFYINAQNTPNKTAVVSSSGNLTYQELAIKSNQIANCLKEIGCIPNKLVAVILKKGWQQLAACYGILQSGSAYLPLDPDWPFNRIADVLAQGQVQIILTQNELLDSLQVNINADNKYKCLCIDDVSFWNSYSSKQLSRQQSLDDIAYVLFTSGSTGKPKGAALTHRNVTNTLFDINDRFEINATDVVLALSNLSFDLSVYDTFALLSAGGTIVMPDSDKTKDPGTWISLIINNKVTIWNTVPMFMRMLIEYTKTLTAYDLAKLKHTLRVIMMSGDFIPLELPREIKLIFTDVAIHSLGGPTECSIWSITYPIKNIDPSWTSIPYGKALANQQVYVLNEDLDCCPVQVEGSIYIAGIGVGQCYWRDEKLTNEKFIIHPKTKQRIFKTGDLGKLRSDGNIEILGREDHQVKISGYRVELGEIKKAIKNIDGVDDAIVVASGDKLSDKKLIGYVMWKKKNSEISEREMLKFKQSHFNIRRNDLLDEKIKLDLPIIDQNFINSYFKRKSYRQFDKEIIKDSSILELFKLQRPNVLDAGSNLSFLDKLSILLQEMYAYQDEKLLLPKYRYPSAGSLYPVQLFMVINSPEEKTINGSYYYHPHEHMLYKISDHYDSATNNITIHLISNIDAIKPLYGDWTEVFCELECGYMTEYFEIACNRLGAQLHKIELDENLPSQLKCLANCRYHYSLAIDLLSPIKPNTNLVLNLTQDVNMLVYIKPNRVTNFMGGLYQWKDQQLEYLAEWQPSDEYLNQVGMLASTMQSAAFVLFFIGKRKSNNNYLIGNVSQNIINKAIEHDIGSCSLGYFGTKIEGLMEKIQGDILHTIVMGHVSKDQMQSHEYSEADKGLWDIKNYINNKIKQTLPKYMLPESYLEIDNIPLSANGKVDIKSLPKHGINNSENKQFISPKNSIEKKISALWCEILDLPQVSINDNFFEIGGNSIKVITLRNKINESFELDIDIVDLFNNPTIRLLAEKFFLQNDANAAINEENDAEITTKRKKMINRFREEYEES